MSISGVFVVSLSFANPLAAYAWCAVPIVCCTLIAYMLVNQADTVYLTRVARFRLNWLPSGLLLVVSIGLDAYSLHMSFFASPWREGFKLGQAVIYPSMLFLVLAIVYVCDLKYRTPERLSGTLTAFQRVGRVGGLVWWASPPLKSDSDE